MIAAEIKMNTFSEENIYQIRKDFPILSQTAYGKPLIYFDNAATSQKPQVVIDVLTKYYSEYNANISFPCEKTSSNTL